MEKQGLFQKLRQGLTKTRSGILSSVFSIHDGINEDLYEELEEALIMADVGADLTSRLIDELRVRIKSEKLSTADEAKNALIAVLAERMLADEPFIGDSGLAALLIVGVNGVGKTTSIGKLADYYSKHGRKPMLAAADTFRAAAAEQLQVWADRANVPMVRHNEGADPAAVVYDSIASLKAKGRDTLICDTAGRLHNKKNLMAELEKISRVIAREMPGADIRALLVLDATAGQNAIIQAKAFIGVAGLTDVILTKLDGTAKGGAAIAVKDALGLPVRFIGLGEGIDDLQPFSAEEFARALFE